MRNINQNPFTEGAWQSPQGMPQRKESFSIVFCSWSQANPWTAAIDEQQEGYFSHDFKHMRGSIWASYQQRPHDRIEHHITQVHHIAKWIRDIMRQQDEISALKRAAVFNLFYMNTEGPMYKPLQQTLQPTCWLVTSVLWTFSFMKNITLWNQFLTASLHLKEPHKLHMKNKHAKFTLDKSKNASFLSSQDMSNRTMASEPWRVIFGIVGPSVWLVVLRWPMAPYSSFSWE